MINLEKSVINLEKSIQKAGIDLEKRKCNVVFCIDNSGSMYELYRNKIVQKVTERIFPVAMKFDDDQRLEFYTFDHEYKKYPDVTINNLDNYIDNNRIKDSGGTEYANPMRQILIEKSNDLLPTMVIFITDGDSSDKIETEKLIIEASKYPIFFKFIGIGGARFDFLEKLDDLDGRYVDNANFIKINNIDSVSDEELYDMILVEFDDWYKIKTKSSQYQETSISDGSEVRKPKRKKIFGLF